MQENTEESGDYKCGGRCKYKVLEMKSLK